MIKLNKYPLKWFALASVIVLALTIVFVAIFGVKTSVEVGGGSQIEVRLTYSATDGIDDEKLSDEQYTAKFVSQIKGVLRKHSASVDSYFVEDKLVDTYLVVKVAKANIKNAESLPAEIAQALNIDVSRVSDVIRLGSYFNNSSLLFIGLGILTLVVLLFFAGWLRYGLMSGITLPFAFLYNLIMSLAVIFLLRVQFSMVSLVSIVLFSLLAVWFVAMLLERVKENSKSSAYQSYTNDQHMFKATKQNWFYGLIAAAVVVACIVLICVPIKYVQLAALSAFIAIVIACFSAVCMAPALHCYLLEIKQLRPARKKKSKQKTENKQQPKEAV